MDMNPPHLAIKATVAESGLSYVKEVVVSIKEPRFANMIFDEYLPYTLLLIALLLVIAILSVLVIVSLERTKEERARIGRTHHHTGPLRPLFRPRLCAQGCLRVV